MMTPATKNEIANKMVTFCLQNKQEAMPITEVAGDDPKDPRSRTYVFEGEGHTLGNALRNVISRYPDVTFCGYTVPHPSETKINFRIQTNGPEAIDVLRRGLADLEQHCQHIRDVFQSEVSSFKLSNTTATPPSNQSMSSL